MTEEQGPRELVVNARRAEQAGFDFVAISDHFFPWLDEQGHAPFAWSVLGAIATATERVGTSAVTCPTFRYHPAVVAQAAATVGVLSGGRFSLGVGSGERLNEHVVARHWPSVGPRQAMLGEAIEIIRRLFDGGMHSYRGRYFELEQGRLYDLPDSPPPILMAASGEQAAALAAEKGDGMFTTQPDAELIRAYREVGGGGPLYTEATLCYASDEREARTLLRELHRWSALGWEVLPELATPAAFDAASRAVRTHDLAGRIPCGPDPERHLEAIREYVDAGYDHVVLHAVGPDQGAFFDFFERELAPRLRELHGGTPQRSAGARA